MRPSRAIRARLHQSALHLDDPTFGLNYDALVGVGAGDGRCVDAARVESASSR